VYTVDSDNENLVLPDHQIDSVMKTQEGQNEGQQRIIVSSGQMLT